jgi:hypothetical protein
MPFDYEQWKKAQFVGSPVVQQLDHAAVAFPAAITFAGLIWVGMGCLALLSVAVLSAQTGEIRTPGSIVAGLLFIYGGLRAMSGTTPGTFRSGIASILLGFVWAVVGFVTPSMGIRSVVVQLVSCGMGGAMMLAGLLAVTANSNYQRWRASQAMSVSRSAGR